VIPRIEIATLSSIYSAAEATAWKDCSFVALEGQDRYCDQESGWGVRDGPLLLMDARIAYVLARRGLVRGSNPGQQ
jgi:hypothetical protein